MPLFNAARPFALALLLAAPTAGRSQGADATYDLYISGIKAGRLTMSSELTGDRYTAATDMTSAGVLGVFADFYFRGTSSGRLDGNGGVVPQQFVARSKSNRAERETRIDWRDGTPVEVSVQPPRDSAPDPTAQSGTLDPVSALYLLLRDTPRDAVCDKVVEVFDGSRRSRLTLAAPRSEGDQLVCDGRFARLEGEAHSLSSADREYPFSLVYRDTGAGDAKMQRIESPTSFGTAVVERRG